MKKLTAVMIALMMVFALACAALAEGPAEAISMTGGWQSAENAEITEEIRTLFDKGMEKLIGVSYVPAAYLGSQVVAGTNHAILCQGTVIYPGAKPDWKVVFLWEKLDGTVELINVADFDFGALCTYGAEADS